MSKEPILPYGRQSIDDSDIAAVVEALKGDYLTTGPRIAEFEEAVAEYVDAKYAVAFSNATAGLHACCAVADLGPGSVVATTPLTFAASANCAMYVGASVELIDIDPATLNMDTGAVGEHVDALVAVHYAGLPVDLTALNYRPRVVIEDAAQALGSMTPDGPVGNCAHSDMVCFSFHPVKPVTTAEGGLVTTNDEELAKRLRRFRSHGIEHRPENGGWYQEVIDEGFNYRLTDIQAALGTSQMTKLESFILRRNELAERYDELLSGVANLEISPKAPEGYRHGYHLYVVRVPQRRRVYDMLRERGIYTQVHYVPVHHHPRFSDISGSFPVTDEIYEQILTLPLYPTMTDADQDRVVASLTEVLAELGY